jgi:hypothetical protein
MRCSLGIFNIFKQNLRGDRFCDFLNCICKKEMSDESHICHVWPSFRDNLGHFIRGQPAKGSHPMKYCVC